MRVLSLFDGIGSGYLALERAGIPIDSYYASEIDKYAISIAKRNFPNIIELGNVFDIDFTHYKNKIDIIFSAFPCTDLSVSKQNREGLKGKESSKFFAFLDALKIIHPKYFLVENVASMKTNERDTITKLLQNLYPNTQYIMINSALVSAQQRKRYYWTNWNVKLPEDKQITIQNIIKENVYPCALRTWPRTKQLGIKRIKRLEIKKDGKANCLTTVTSDSMVCFPATNQTQKIYECDGKNWMVRKLTPQECEKLQTLPENFTALGQNNEKISNSQRYKASGDGWTIDVIAHILKFLKN